MISSKPSKIKRKNGWGNFMKSRNWERLMKTSQLKRNLNHQKEKKLAAQRARMWNICARGDADTVVGDTPSTTSEYEGTPLSTSEYGGTPSTTSEYGWTPSTTSKVESTSSLGIEEQGTPSSPCEPQSMSSIPPSIEGTQSSPPQLNIDEIANVQMYVPKRTPPRILHRKPKFLINIDEDILQHMEGKIP